VTHFRMKVEGDEDLERKLHRVVLFGKPLRKFWNRVVITVQKFARKHSPSDRGTLRNSIHYEVSSDQIPMRAEVGTGLFYAPFQDQGTGTQALGGGKSRHFPPGDALQAWAERHGFQDKERADGTVLSAGWQVARIIGRRGGLRPKEFMKKGLDDSRGAIKGFLETLADDIGRIWSS